MLARVSASCSAKAGLHLSTDNRKNLYGNLQKELVRSKSDLRDGPHIGFCGGCESCFCLVLHQNKETRISDEK